MAHSTDFLESTFKSKGLPLTVQRRVVYQNVASRQDHPTADDVYLAVQKEHPDFSRATIYRALDCLVQIDLLSRVASFGSAVRYDAKQEHHDHMHCTQCGQVADVEAGDLNLLPKLKQDLGFTVETYSVHFRGLCPECQLEKTNKEN
ncbi:MAG: transcriptional repressor [Candidatus Eisenbacteria bacterium]|uniref:Transcriptional repressor n=1 Tax=Eiseniibacteriota bacterium TaxID=2212470 RepID=A0A7Y2H0Y6_UNCEI|nr:transcriptional repressor [Candidatus Eisenbacteria bacterium]